MEYKDKFERALDGFGNFWEQYRSDIILRIEDVLTEPTCPVAIVEFELDRAPFKTISAVHADTIEEAIRRATDAAVERLSQFKGMSYDEIKAAIKKENTQHRTEREARMKELQELAKGTPCQFECDISELFDDTGKE